MINKFDTINGFGVYVNYTWPSALPAFARYNVIYGWNGSGKSTLARVFRCLEARTKPPHGSHIKVSTRTTTYTPDAFGRFHIPVRVFDRVYVEETVFPATGFALPIYVIGKENTDRVKRLTSLKAKLAEAQTTHAAAQQAREEAVKRLNDFCTSRARDIKERGWKDYHTYDRTRFRQRCDLLAADGIDAALLSDVTRDRLDAEQHQRRPATIAPVLPPQTSLRRIHKSLEDLLSQSAAATAIDSLARSPDLARWCREGLRIHHSQRSKECPFCGSIIPPQRLNDLQSHFNAAYEKDLAELERVEAELRRTAAFLAAKPTFDIDNAYDDMREDFEEAICKLAELKGLSAQYCESGLQAIAEKRANMFKPVTPPPPPPTELEKAFEIFNSLVATHTSKGSTHDLHTAECRLRLESHLVAISLPEYLKQKEELRSIEASETAAMCAIRDLTEEIAGLDVEIRNHRIPADKINSDLRAYLGHADLHLEVSDSGYVISRNGIPANNLSEGEKTAISLLYFLHSLDSESFSKQDGVVVLDDPITSLDNNALFCACSFIGERAAGVCQLFLLTHNLFFLHQARKVLGVISNRPGCGGQVNGYMTEIRLRDGNRESHLRSLDRTLGDFGSEYEFLFSIIYRAVFESSAYESQYICLLPNVARRVLEAFFAFRRPGEDKLDNCIKSTAANDALKMRLHRFVQMLSHQKRIEEGDCSFTTDAEVVSRLSDVLELMKIEDSRHYDAMVTRVNALCR